MIVLPDEDEKPVGAQVNAAIGDALRLSVAEAEFSPGFEARLAAALDAEASQDAAPGAAAADAAGQGAQAAEVAS